MKDHPVLYVHHCARQVPLSDVNLLPLFAAAEITPESSPIDACKLMDAPTFENECTCHAGVNTQCRLVYWSSVLPQHCFSTAPAVWEHLGGLDAVASSRFPVVAAAASPQKAC